MQIEITKTNLNTVNRGICASRNNCRYKGSTIVWRIAFQAGDGAELAFYATTQWLAQDFAYWVKDSGYDGLGDAELKFQHSPHAARYRRSKAILASCF